MIRINGYKALKLDTQRDPHLVQVYSVFDRVAGFFNPPYASMNTPEQEALMLKRSAMNEGIKYPNDLDLYLVGIYDTNNGRFVENSTLFVSSLSIGDFSRKEVTNDHIQAQ